MQPLKTDRTILSRPIPRGGAKQVVARLYRLTSTLAAKDSTMAVWDNSPSSFGVRRLHQRQPISTLFPIQLLTKNIRIPTFFLCRRIQAPPLAAVAAEMTCSVPGTCNGARELHHGLAEQYCRPARRGGDPPRN